MKICLKSLLYTYFPHKKKECCLNNKNHIKNTTFSSKAKILILILKLQKIIFNINQSLNLIESILFYVHLF